MEIVVPLALGALVLAAGIAWALHEFVEGARRRLCELQSRLLLAYAELALARDAAALAIAALRIQVMLRERAERQQGARPLDELAVPEFEG